MTQFWATEYLEKTAGALGALGGGLLGAGLGALAGPAIGHSLIDVDLATRSGQFLADGAPSHAEVGDYSGILGSLPGYGSSASPQAPSNEAVHADAVTAAGALGAPLGLVAGAGVGAVLGGHAGRVQESR